jgi:hypothetical protein
MTQTFDRAMIGLLALVILSTIIHCGLVVGGLLSLCGFAFVFVGAALIRRFPRTESAQLS